MADTIHVTVYHGESGLIFGMSEDMPGLLAHGHTMDELRSNLPEAVAAMREVKGLTEPAEFVWPD